MVLFALGAVGVSGVLLYLGTGEKPLWWAIWVAALPLLLVAARLPAIASFGVGTLAWFLGSLNMLRYTVNILAIPNKELEVTKLSSSLAILLFMLVPACVFGLGVLLFGLCARRGAPWRAIFIFPGTWITYEYLASILSPHSTFGNLAYTQMSALPVLQLASVTGVWGISFLLCLFPATIAALLAIESSVQRKRAIVVAVGGTLAIVAAFGFWRLHGESGHEGGGLVRVGLIASDLPQNVNISDPGSDTERKLRDYLEESKLLVESGARVIVLPEKLGVTVPTTSKVDDGLLQAFADKNDEDILVGLVRLSGSNLLNEARLYVPREMAALTYDKHHMLPAFESRLAAGRTPLIIHRESGVWGVAVCKDMDFPGLSRKYGAVGTGLLLVPAWDFDDDDWLHARMAIMRGVESGFSIVRSAKEGLLTISDDRGRVLAYRSSKAAPFSKLVDDVPVLHASTLYVHYGDWFAWCCIIVALATCWTLSNDHTGPLGSRN